MEEGGKQCVSVCELLCLLPPRAVEALAKALCGWVSNARLEQPPALPNNAALPGPRVPDPISL